MVVVPLLNKLFGMEQKKAQATALFVILPISLVSTIVYMCYNSIDFKSGWTVIVGIILGGVVGATLLNKLNNKVVKGTFIFFMFLGGIGMLIWWEYDIFRGFSRSYWRNRWWNGNGRWNTHNTNPYYFSIVRTTSSARNKFNRIFTNECGGTYNTRKKSFSGI